MTQATMTTLQADATALAALYEYPWERPVIADPAFAARLGKLATYLATAPLDEIQDRFTETFDLAPVAPPYLAFQVHGESYRRGALMSKLRAMYLNHDVDEEGELPDHIRPVLKLVAAAGPDEDVDAMIRDELLPGCAKLVAAVPADNPYRVLVAASHAVLAARLA